MSLGDRDRTVAIIGTGQTPYRHRYADLTQPDLIRAATLAALEDSHLTIEDIDAIVYSMAPDALAGVMHAERWVADATGILDGKPIIRVNTGGASGLSSVIAGYEHVLSGLFDKVLVVGADRVGESGEAQTILNRIWDPMYERALPLNTITMLAMQAIRFFHKYDADETDMARVSVKNHYNGARNPYAHIQKEVTIDEVLSSRMISHPLKLLDCCPQSSGAAALVLASPDVADSLGEPCAWITGVGFSVETYWMGDRMGPRATADHADAPALTEAVNRAYAAASIAPSDIDVAELYAPFSSTELHAIQDTGLATPDKLLDKLKDGFFDLHGELPVNPSGGVMCANPIAATALVRALECALQVTGKAGAHQVRNANRALATGVGGDHQFFAAMTISSEPG